MSKYEPLWKYVAAQAQPALRLSFQEIGRIAGTPLDHSFLGAKKELLSYGFQVEKISMKEESVLFTALS